jgi:hypothetical protein
VTSVLQGVGQPAVEDHNSALEDLVEQRHASKCAACSPWAHRVLAIDLSAGYGQWQPDCTECDSTGSWHTNRDEAQGEAMSHHDDTRG